MDDSFKGEVKVERQDEKAEDGNPVPKAEAVETEPKEAGEAQAKQDAILPKNEAEQGGESSGNNVSNGTTQKMEKTEEVAAEASTGKPPADDLQELAARGLCAPLWRTAKPSQAGVAVPDVEQLQTGWCNYNGIPSVQRGATWLAAHSPTWQSRMAQQQSMGGMSMGYGLGLRGAPGLTAYPSGHSGGAHAGSSARQPQSQSPQAAQHQQMTHQHQQPQHNGPQQQERVFSAQPPAAGLLPPSPFSKTNIPQSPFKAPQREGAVPLGMAMLSEDSPFTASTQSKFQWPEDAQSPRQSASDGIQGNMQPREARTSSITRQVSLPDFGELADLWTEMSHVVSDDCLDLDALPSLSKGDMAAPLPGLTSQLSLGIRHNSLARFGRPQDSQTPVGSLLYDIKSQRRNRSMKFNSALTWQPGTGLDPPLQARRNSGRLQSLQMGPSIREKLSMGDRSGSSGFHSSGEGPRVSRGPELPEQVQLSIIGAPSIFAVPTCINKSFKPAFTIRVSVVSSRPTQIKATVAAYTLQREQVAKLEQWHPSQHIFTESLAGSIESESIICDGPDNKRTGETYPGKHVGTGDLVFSDLKFNSSSRMKPRWLVFALALPTDDVIFVQYTVPTIVMSRQCDQIPRALAILRGEVPTRKRARQHDGSDQPRARTPFPGITTATPLATPPPTLGASLLPNFLASPMLGSRPGNFQPPDQESITAGSLYSSPETDWPQQGPYTMQRWRESIVKVCRAFGLTRSFEQEDMHELAKVAGFMGSPQSGGQQASVLSLQQWNIFGKWFLSYLLILRDHKDLWMSPNVMIICGFSVTRERSETLLLSQPEGTFLLRPSLSMESTIVISVVMNGRICHLAVDQHQLESRSIQDWVRELQEVQYLLDINTGIRYPKLQIFRYRSVAPQHGPLLLGLPGGLMNPAGGPAMRSNGLMPMAPQGADALAHIFEASRRSSEGFLQQSPGIMGHQPMQLGNAPPLQGMNEAPPAHVGHLFDQWSPVDLRDPFRAPQMNRMDPIPPGMMYPGHSNAMRFGPQ